MELDTERDEVVNLFESGFLYDHSGLSPELAGAVDHGVLHLPGREGVRKSIRLAWFGTNVYQGGRAEPVFEILGSSDRFFASAFASLEVDGQVIPALGRRVLPRILP